MPSDREIRRFITADTRDTNARFKRNGTTTFVRSPQRSRRPCACRLQAATSSSGVASTSSRRLTPPRHQTKNSISSATTTPRTNTKRCGVWLKRHPRFHIHFTPTSSSWLNLIDVGFASSRRKCIRRGAFRSVPKLQDAIWEFIEHHNEEPKALKWTAKPDRILARVARARARAKLDKCLAD